MSQEIRNGMQIDQDILFLFPEKFQSPKTSLHKKKNRVVIIYRY
jgi:hypothetical protein